MKRGHRPQRTCLGCGAKDDKEVLLRFVAQPDRELKPGDGSGRGGYLHKSEGCWEAFVRRKSVYKAFRVEIGREARKKLIHALREKYRE